LAPVVLLTVVTPLTTGNEPVAEVMALDVWADQLVPLPTAGTASSPPAALTRRLGGDGSGFLTEGAHGSSVHVVLGYVIVKHPSFGAGVFATTLRHASTCRSFAGFAEAPLGTGATEDVVTPVSALDPDPEQAATTAPTASAPAPSRKCA
jgi:hypothetical protein